jgi:hypothetical protein
VSNIKCGLLRIKFQSKLRYYTKKDKPYGFSFGEWTVKWWEWAVSLPIDISPIVDETGKYANMNQNGPVWFLAGTLGENKMPIRNCVIPFGKGLLFPVINYEINQLEDPNLRTENAMVKHVVDDINDIINKDAIVDGNRIPTYRVQSSPKVFPLYVCKDNWLNISPGLIKAAADGYWVFLKPLDTGKHEIYFHGSCSGGLRNSTARYSITVSN